VQIITVIHQPTNRPASPARWDATCCPSLILPMMASSMVPMIGV